MIASSLRANEPTVQRHLELVWELARAQLKSRDQSTIIGFGWSFLNPLLMVALLFVFFNGQIGQDIPFYSIFLLVGLVHFTHFSNATLLGATTLTSMEHLTANTVFPKITLVIASVMASSFEFVVSMAICVALAVAIGVPITGTLALVPLVMLLQVWMVLWIALLLSCVFVFARDMGHIYQVFLRALFFITPTFYRPDFLGDGIASTIIGVNPLAHSMTLTRSALTGSEVFSFVVFGALVILNVGATVAAVMIFRMCEPSFAEHV